MQVKIGRINAHKHIGAYEFQFFNQIAAYAQNFRQVRQYFKITAYRQFFLFKQAFKAFVFHARAANAHKSGLWVLAFNGFNQMCAQQIARGFASTHRNNDFLL